MNMNSVSGPEHQAISRARAQPAERAAVMPEEHPPEAVEALQHFRMIFRSVRRHFHDVEERCGINGSQAWALAVVARAPGIRVKDLARAMAVQQSTASNLVEQLARQGLLRRVRDQRDQRIVLLHPTQAGEDAVAHASKPLVGILPDALSRLGPKRLTVLNRLLHEIEVAMQVEGAEAKHLTIVDL